MASSCGCSGCSLMLPRSSRISAPGMALSSGCAGVDGWTAPVSSCRVAGPLRLGVACPLRLSIGLRLSFPLCRQTPDVPGDSVSLWRLTRLTAWSQSARNSQVQRGVWFNNQPWNVLFELLRALGSGLNHQEVRMVSRTKHVYQVDLRVHPAPLRQRGQDVRRSVSDYVTLASRLRRRPLW